ncbi:hypothetical protein RUE5091_01314 [Ruegeria denitrificans]|uniref:Uncharacterized protein n=1 Tax=Ruegeria denitrificans TaxID=1715692 RepID=A0A0N7M908_9RHOB|nr:hypothetical protein [Ruegeria denitrificans]CUJ93254.1 hypothetical protein RUE5091_01314 [Ruegeria denitrificans]
MADSKLIGIVTALLFLASTQHARAEISLEHLLTIDQLLSTNDTQALQSYLERNPELLTGDDELSAELRNFYNAATTGNLNFGYTAGPVGAAGTEATENELLH